MRDISSWKKKAANELKRILDDNSPLYSKRILDIELGLFLWEQLAPKENCKDLWVILAGYNFNTDSYNELTVEQRKKISNLRFYLQNYKSRRFWEECIDKYKEITDRIRLYNIDDEGMLERKNPGVLSTRPHLYETTIRTCPRHKVEDRQWIKTGKEVYFWNDRKLNSAIIPSSWEQLKNSQDYRLNYPDKKTRSAISVKLKELYETARWMDDKFPGDKSWYSRLERTDLEILLDNDKQDIDSEDKTLTLDGAFHLVGMVSSGKSTLMEVLAVWAAKNNLHITIVLDTIVSVVNFVEVMRKLNINAAPILGSSNKTEQLKKVHQNNKVNSLDPWQEESLDVFDWLSTSCPLNGLSSNTTYYLEPGREPCHQLLEENPNEEDIKQKKKSCPAFYNCPTHKSSRSLNIANIWVATPASLIYTRLPWQIDSRRLRFLEAVYRKSDVVVFDEADRVQLQLDSFFTSEQMLADETRISWLNQLGNEVETSFYTYGRAQLLHRDINNWYRNHQNIQGAVNNVHTMLNDNVTLKKWVRGEFFTTQWLIEKFIEEIKLEKEQNDFNANTENMEAQLESFRRDPFGERVENPGLLNETAAFTFLGTNSNLLQHKFVDWLTMYDITSANINKENFYSILTKLKFIITLAVLERSLWTILRDWDLAEEEFNLVAENLEFFKNTLWDYIPLVPEAPQGNVFGFKYFDNGPQFDNKNKKVGKLLAFRAMGVGRELLLNFHNLFVKSEEIYGPHTLLMSGTSWAPKSPAYHVQIKPNGILKSPNEELEAIKKSNFIFEPGCTQDGEPISVSGKSGIERENNLERLINYLTDQSLNNKCKLEEELDNLDEDRKRILLLVGSYEEASIVKKQLDATRIWSEDKICKLIKDDQVDFDGTVIRRGEVDKFATYEAKILVAPLLALERGHNILNKDNVAAFGTAYFLVRPMPVPTDIMQDVLYLNHWAINRRQTQNKWEIYNVGNVGKEFRREATKIWQTRLSKYKDFKSLSKNDREALCWTQLVLIWQVIGRLIRGGQPAKVYFSDASFAPNTAKEEGKDTSETSLLVGIKEVLRPYLGKYAKEDNISQYEIKIANALYDPLAEALENMRGIKDE
ncbi:hypothetical protein [Natranaerofaba carboxydovora]|uniref:pPIWI_RE_Z domain-containing protein n=1 Tax=Natranaerofaba carboxydovora TaxID=2742683 RepID=UPI001F13652F|nr:hypothetical protein [Natranaerofaba carboxydovora]UMZ73721.1 hypothetical protein ACONDI_01287 [Natranaerofaba carboxydovora]